MKYKILGENKKENYLNEILANRKIPVSYDKYLYTTDSVINDYRLLDNIEAGCSTLKKHLDASDGIFILVDCDVDGITSAATLWNFIKEEIDPKANLKFAVHEGKMHGLADTLDYIEKKECKLVIIPDAGSNDFEQQLALKNTGADVLILDHHDCPTYSKNAIVVNNQMSKNYPNKNLSGAGVVWQFLRCYNDMFLNSKVDMTNYLDLVALGNTADQMSLLSLETKHLIHKGFSNLRNPMFIGLCTAQKFSMKGIVSPYTVGWYISPMLNSVCRIGSLEEKKNLFKAFLVENATTEVLSTKRGSYAGETEVYCEQQIRIAQNIRNRQNKIVESKMTMVENLISLYHLDNNKLLLIDVPDNMLPQEIVGLIANKIASKYKHPTVLLRRITGDDGEKLLSGSIRNFGNSPVENFRKELEDSGLVIYAQGHPSAAGVSLKAANKDALIAYFETKWADMTFDPAYTVDFTFDYEKDKDTLAQSILSIAELNKFNLWGQDMPEPSILVTNLPSDNSKIIGRSKNTIKIEEGNFNIMKFFTNSDACEQIKEYGSIDAICTCANNFWQGVSTPQLMVTDYEQSAKPLAKSGWSSF